ncbi:MAG: hypothetical protein QOI31_3 [Solirubrobacterales bacterium]|nr:hypothetical protein [Solirubrobacterales bacterium]
MGITGRNRRARFELAGGLLAGLLAACAITATSAPGAGSGSTLNRPDEPIVIQQTQPAANGGATGARNVDLPASLLGIAPENLIAFSWDGAWQQIPVQVDEREVMDLNRIYGPGYPSCSDPCYSKPPNGAVHIEYNDPDTWVGPDSNPLLDANDEVALMAHDAGGKTTSPYAPAGVDPASGVETKITDPLNSGDEGYVYLFIDGGGLDPGAGANYVDYDFSLDGGKTYKDPTGPYKVTGTTAPSMARGPRPEHSVVNTANYTRGFSDRWVDNEVRVHRGGASNADILDRHDAQFDNADLSCVRTQETYRSGEGAFVTNKQGPVRAIRDFVGANSGPHVQRQHIFYDAKEAINTYLRVHPVPGVTDFFDYSAAGVGLTYKNSANTAGVTIDGTPDALVPFTGATGLDGWETVNGPQGGLSMPQSFVTNNSDPSYHGNYRDGNLLNQDLCTGDNQLYGASGPQGNSAFENTDEASRGSYGGTFKNLYYKRAIFYEAPGQADGAKRLAEEQNPLHLAFSSAGLIAEPPNLPPTASFTFTPGSPTTGDTVDLTSTSVDGDGTIAAADTRWDLDDDGEFDDATGLTASTSFATAGPHEVWLEVTDDDDAVDTTFRTVNVDAPPANVPPAASFTAVPEIATTGQTIDLTSTSIDTDGTIAADNTRWDLDDDGEFDDATGLMASTSFAVAGDHDVGLEVTDDDGDSDTTFRTIQVNEPPNIPPVAGFDFTPAAPVAGEPVSFNSTSIDTDGTLSSFAWDLDDDGALNDAEDAGPTYVFSTAGDHEVTLRVSDDDGATDAVTKSVHVVSAPVNGSPAAGSPAPVLTPNAAVRGCTKKKRRHRKRAKRCRRRHRQHHR